MRGVHRLVHAVEALVRGVRTSPRPARRGAARGAPRREAAETRRSGCVRSSRRAFPSPTRAAARRKPGPFLFLQPFSGRRRDPGAAFLTIWPHATSAAAASLSGGAVSTPSTAPYAASPGFKTSTEARTILKSRVPRRRRRSAPSPSQGSPHRLLFRSASARDSQYARARALCACLAARGSTSMGAEKTGSASLAAARETPAPTSLAPALPSVGECALRPLRRGVVQGQRRRRPLARGALLPGARDPPAGDVDGDAGVAGGESRSRREAGKRVPARADRRRGSRRNPRAPKKPRARRGARPPPRPPPRRVAPREEPPASP